MALTDTSGSNDVWNTISKGVSDYFNFRTVEAQSRTMAAPSGAPASNNANPFPGTQGPYPQAEAKPTPGASGFSFSFGKSGAWIVAAVVGLILFALVARR